MKSRILTVVMLSLAVVVMLSSCSEIRRQASKKATEGLTSMAADKAASSETCNTALGVKYDSEETKYFGEKAGTAMNEACKTAKSWDNCVELSKEPVTKVFEEAVKGAEVNEECIAILTNDFMTAMADQVSDMYDNQ